MAHVGEARQFAGSSIVALDRGSSSAPLPMGFMDQRSICASRPTSCPCGVTRIELDPPSHDPLRRWRVNDQKRKSELPERGHRVRAEVGLNASSRRARVGSGDPQIA